MKMIGGKKPSWYIGLRARCQFCQQLVEFDTEGDVTMVERGDWTEESKYAFECPNCTGRTITGPSRLKDDSARLMKAER